MVHGVRGPRCFPPVHLVLVAVTTQSLSLRLADQLARSPFTWPGGYPCFAVTSDGGVLCPSCCKAEGELIGTTTGSDGWCVVGVDINWEDPSLSCDHCGDRIESAYVEGQAIA
jgi:hypothetical protein